MIGSMLLMLHLTTITNKSTQLEPSQVGKVNLGKFLEQRDCNSDKNVSRHAAFDQTVDKGLYKQLIGHDITLNANLDLIVQFLKPNVISAEHLPRLSLDKVLVCELFEKDILANGD